MTTSAVSRLRQLQARNPMAARLARHGPGRPLSPVHRARAARRRPGADQRRRIHHHSRADTFAPPPQTMRALCACAGGARCGFVGCGGWRIYLPTARRRHRGPRNRRWPAPASALPPARPARRITSPRLITTASGARLAARFSLRAGGCAVCLGIAGRRQQLCLFDLQAGAVVAATSGTASIAVDPYKRSGPDLLTNRVIRVDQSGWTQESSGVPCSPCGRMALLRMSL